MKKAIIALALAFSLAGGVAHAQFIRNDTPSNLRDLGSNLQVGANVSVTQKGQLRVVVDAGSAALGSVTVTDVVPGVSATNLGKAAGAQWTVADTGVGAWGVRNDSGTTLMADNNDYGPLGLTAQGWVRANVTGQDQPASATGLMKTEDAAAGNGDMAPAVQSVRQDTLASSVDTDGDFGYQKMDALGAQWVRERHAATGATTSVNDTASSTTCLAANAARNLATLYNDSTVNAYIKFGATASTTSFATIIPAQGLYEVPKQYSGIIDCIWASDASGAMRVTEVTY